MPLRRTASDSNHDAAFLSPASMKLQRIRKLTSDELKTRATQAIRKRTELARFRVGLANSLPALDSSRSVWGKFYFRAEDLPLLSAAMAEQLPAQADSVIRNAEGICNHQFRLLGYDKVVYESDIDWHLDPIHGKRAPVLPWFKVPFLNFDIVGDHKIIWELNRHQHLVTLAKAWLLTKEQKYVAELVSQWQSWKSSNPYPLGINWASSLEVAFRSLSWLWVRFLLRECPTFSEDFERDLLQGLSRHGAYIEHYLSTYFSPNTHLLGEALALFSIGTLCPQISSAARWQRCGSQILLREAERQVRPDGSYFEQSLYYHVYALDILLHFRQLAACNEIAIPENFDVILNRMLGFLQVVSRGGPPEGFGDDDGGRLFDPTRNRSEHMTDPLATGALLFHRDDLKSRAALTEEALWLFGATATRGLPCTAKNTALASSANESAGIYIVGSSGCQPQRMTIDAGNMGAGRGGHGHADALSVTVSLNGRRWLVDPGTCSYVGSDGVRDQFRGTAAHNTLLVDGVDQAVPDGPFAWRFLPETRVERWVTGNTFTLLTANHTGYLRLPDPVLHRRMTFHLHGSFWFARDVVEGKGDHELQISWHFAPELVVRRDLNSFIASQPLDLAGDAHFALVFSESPEWNHLLERGEVSPVYGRRMPAPILRSRASLKLPTECGTILLPIADRVVKPGELAIANGTTVGSNPHAYRYTDSTEAHSLFFSEQPKPWTLLDWESDATFLYSATRNGELTHLILCGGTYAKRAGVTLFSHSKMIERFEWLKSGAVFASETSGYSAGLARES